ncbi:MAG: amino acid adenylation domain-containing protein, partial [Chloroflexota bacterium]
KNQQYPFPLLVQKLQMERDPSRSPIFQASFTYQQPGQANEPAIPESNAAQTMMDTMPDSSKWELLDLFRQEGTFDLVLEAVENQETLLAAFKYNPDLFEEETIKRLARHFNTLLTSIATHADQPISTLNLLQPAEKEQLLIEWNQTETPIPDDKCMQELFEEQVERTPDAIAAIYEDQQITYQELSNRTNALARILIERGVEQDVVVPIMANRSIDFLTAMVAIFKAGGIYLPLDPLQPPERVRQMLVQSRTPMVFVADQFKDALAQAIEGLPAEQPVDSMSLEAMIAASHAPTANTDQVTGRIGPDDMAYVIFTSGSTGLPKGAMVEHKGMVNHLYAKIIDLELTENDSVAQNAPQSFDISVWQFLVALVVGGRTHVFNDEISRDPTRLLEEVADHQVTILEVVPSLMRMMVETTKQPDLSKLRWLIPTGEALPPILTKQWLERYPAIPLVNAYGPTECSDDVTHYPIYEPPPEYVVNMPIGRPIVNMQMYILDKHLQPVPQGVAGELYVGGIGVGRGYLNDAERTGKAFLDDPFSQAPGARLYKTGDLGRYLPDGNIEFLGRVDFQVKIRGYRIELGEIKTALEGHPNIRETVVIAHDSRPGIKQLVAYIVPTAEAATDDGSPSVATTELRTYLKGKIPEYMVPAVFIWLEAMPLTPNGKVNRAALPEPDADRPELDSNYVAPSTPLEQLLANHWQEVLGLEQIGIHD